MSNHSNQPVQALNIAERHRKSKRTVQSEKPAASMPSTRHTSVPSDGRPAESSTAVLPGPSVMPSSGAGEATRVTLTLPTDLGWELQRLAVERRIRVRALVVALLPDGVTRSTSETRPCTADVDLRTS